MEANLNYKRIRIIDISEDAEVPSNDIAYLMYYLKCVFSVLKCNSFSEYTNYNNYNTLSSSDINELIRLVKMFNPELMIKLKVFILKEDLDFANRFIDVTDEAMNIHSNQEIIIGGISTNLSQLMLYRSKWLIDVYYSPLNRFAHRINNSQGPSAGDSNSNPYKFKNTYSNDEVCCCIIF
mgnify:CR=1 FL=1